MEETLGGTPLFALPDLVPSAMVLTFIAAEETPRLHIALFNMMRAEAGGLNGHQLGTERVLPHQSSDVCPYDQRFMMTEEKPVFSSNRLYFR